MFIEIRLKHNQLVKIDLIKEHSYALMSYSIYVCYLIILHKLHFVSVSRNLILCTGQQLCVTTHNEFKNKNYLVKGKQIFLSSLLCLLVI